MKEWMKQRRYSVVGVRKSMIVAVLMLAVCWYVVIPVMIVLYKLVRVPHLLREVDIGRDQWIPKKSDERIPAILHGLTPENTHGVPLEWETSYDSCHGIHHRYGDTYSWKLYTDADMRAFMKENYGWFLETYDAYPYNIQRVDAARYFIVRHYGGIYLDLDVGCKRSLDNLRRIDGVGMVVPATSPMGISNDFFMAAVDHPFMIFLTERLMSSASSCWWSSYLSVMFSTGPAFMSLALYDYIAAHNDAVNGSSTNLDAGMGILAHNDYTRTMFFHLEGNSWIAGDGVVIMYVFNNLAFVIFVVLLVFGLLYLRGWQISSQRKMKNVDSFFTFSGIVLRLALDEVSTKATKTKGRIKDGYEASKARVFGSFRREKSSHTKKSARAKKESRNNRGMTDKEGEPRAESLESLV